MSDVIIFLAVGFVGIIITILVINLTFGERLRYLHISVSLKQGIKFEIRTHRPQFNISLRHVRAKRRGELIMGNNSNQTNQKSDFDPKSTKSDASILVGNLDNEPEESDFMNDEYQVEIAALLQMHSEEGDLVRFLDHTVETSKE